MKNERGSTLVIALVLLTIITLVAVYALEGSTLQAKMVANSLFTTLTYQECRNEQEVDVRAMNINGGAQRSLLITAKQTGIPYVLDDTLTEAYEKNTPHSDLKITWTYIADAPAARGGYDIDSDSQIKTYIFENDCLATFRFSTESQTLGATVDGLEQAGTLN